MTQTKRGSSEDLVHLLLYGNRGAQRAARWFQRLDDIVFSIAVNTTQHAGWERTNLTRLLSVIPRPCVRPPETFIARIRSCSITMSDQLPLQNCSVRRIAKYPRVTNFFKSSLERKFGESSICCT